MSEPQVMLVLVFHSTNYLPAVYYLLKKNANNYVLICYRWLTVEEITELYHGLMINDYRVPRPDVDQLSTTSTTNIDDVS